MQDNSGRSILDRIFDCVNLGVEWSTKQLKSACPHRWKKEEEEEEEERQRIADRSLVGEEQDDAHIEKGDGEKGSVGEEDTYTERHDSPYSGRGYKDPRCCDIKMQDPCAPCCCEPRQPPPCPPKVYPEMPREPTCGCDLCQKGNAGHKCCERTFTNSTTDPRFFENA